MLREDIQALAKLEVRQFFDHYLTNVLPQREADLRADALAAVQSHNDNREAHGGVETKVSKLLWIIVGSGASGAGAMAAVQKLFH